MTDFIIVTIIIYYAIVYRVSNEFFPFCNFMIAIKTAVDNDSSYAFAGIRFILFKFHHWIPHFAK